jgi:methyl-accepting chemotaxis protein
MDEVTQQNAALVEQAAAAAESLEEQAHNLAQAVSVFAIAKDKSMSRRESPGARHSTAPARAALPHREPVRLVEPSAKSSARLVSNKDDEWEEF